MNKLLSLAAIILTTVMAAHPTAYGGELKPRLVVLTDIAPGNIEPDDMESMVRLMTYADQVEIEALITTIGWNCDPYPVEWADSLQRVINAYELDVKNLMKRSGQKNFLPVAAEQGSQEVGYWPSANYLRSRVAMGSRRAGIGVIGSDNSSAGSDLIIRLADEDDPRPLWIASWGGANTLAQAIWQVKQQRTVEELRKFLGKLRVYTITDQDMQYNMRMNRAYSSHQWMRHEFARDLLFIWDESAWLSQNSLGKTNWDAYASKIQGHGHLGQAYPTYKWGVEGDTPSFLHILPNGLHEPDEPSQVGWAGCFCRDMCPDSLTISWTNWREPQKDISSQYENRFYTDTFNDFASRIEWAAKGKGNRNPVVIVNGHDGTTPLRLSATAGTSVTLDSSASFDPDGDGIDFMWWIQHDASHNSEKVLLAGQQSSATLTIPQDMEEGEIHLICEVHDKAAIPLAAYRRIIISVKHK